MNKTIDYLGMITKAYPEIKNDAELARFLGIHPQGINNYKRKGYAMEPYIAVRIAQALKIDPMETIAATMYEQSEHKPERAEFWKTIYDEKTVKPQDQISDRQEANLYTQQQQQIRYADKLTIRSRENNS